MSYEMVLEACSFCTALIKLNVALLSNNNEIQYRLEKKKLFDKVREENSDLINKSDEEIHKLLSAVYVSNIDNDKYGKNKLGN